ncbi:tight junction-associated protein 1 isoform X2 [Dendrobates tinctorius]|uniref:tight junction-associated protein 1 isoform X2 n=1 Tax=Dendrobates tinctorius TaxID=92724 RepID=UPI003CCA2141
MGLRQFLSHSGESIATSEVGKLESKNCSLERSLVFKEPAEVLAPKKAQHSSSGQPLKSILKHPDTLRSPSHPGSPSPDCKTLQERANFSRFLDEITYRVLSPTNQQTAQRRGGNTNDEAPLFVRTPGNGCGRPAEERHGRKTGHRRAAGRRSSSDRRHEAASHTKERCPSPSEQGFLDTESLSSASHWSPEGNSPSPRTSPSLTAARYKEPVTEADRIHFLQHQNDELRRRLAYATTKMEAMEHEVDAGRHYLEMEVSRNREELEKIKDKFRRLQNSYTASQRTNQDLEEKLHTLIKKAEMDRKTLDWEIVELTNKLLDAKTTINKLEELNERYRQDCNLAVQLLKCNKSHFRNHKFADLPYKLQDMVSKHLQSAASSLGSGQDTPPPGLSHSDVVPTSVIARVLEKPESLILNSATSSSGSGPTAEDVFVHVDMSGSTQQENGVLQKQNSVDSATEEPPAFEKLSPYPTPPPPHPLYPGRKVIEFSDEKVRIPKNSPLPNCTYATRQAISLSLVQGEEGSPDRHRTVPNSPASSGGYPQRARSADNPSRSPLSSAAPSSASSEEDMLANWQRMFVDKAAPSSEGSLAHRTSFSRDTALELQQRFSRSMQELSHVAQAFSEREMSGHSWMSSREKGSEKDNSGTKRGQLPNEYGKEFSKEEAQDLLSGDVEEEDVEPLQLSKDIDEDQELEDQILHACEEQEDGDILKEKPPSSRPHRSPKRMGVHHLHRKDSLTRAQEQGNLLN